MKFNEVVLKDGFWKDMYDRNADVSIYSVQKQFENSGRFEAMRYTHAQNPDVPMHIYFDSDVAKWMEAVAYLLMNNREKYRALEDFCDGLIESLAEHQMENGYLNSYFQQMFTEMIFTDRGVHELYCIGHLTEAAIAYDEATGKRKFLDVVEKALDNINRVFIIEKSASFATPGHQEIELALLKIYDYTGNKKYLDMAKYFINERGRNSLDPKEAVLKEGNEYYQQDNLPAEQLSEPDGHAVRAFYYYIAMADLAVKTNNQNLKQACIRLYENTVNKKMYITGGVGSARIGECFSKEYYLPNSTAYSESCAAISLMMFCKKMLEVEHISKYSDTIEKVLYNGFLSSNSLDGKSFFYENPLEINLGERETETCILPEYRTKFPKTERLEVFFCSCCPPNVNRVLASISDYFYTETEDTVFIEQYAPSVVPKYGIEVAADFPFSGNITVTGDGYPLKKIAIRIPAWCEEYTFSEKASLQNGYAVFSVGDTFKIDIEFKQKVKFVYSNTKVFSNIGRAALTFGPIVYCLEGMDNGDELTSLFVDTQSEIKFTDGGFQPLPRIICDGVRIKTDNSLYSTEKPKKIPEKLTYIPYFTFANRGEQNMQVWVNVL